MKKLIVSVIFMLSLTGCSSAEKYLENTVEAEKPVEFNYQYEILDVDVFGDTAPSIAVVIQVENAFIPVKIDYVPSDVSYDQIVGSVLYSTKPIKKRYDDYERKLKIKAK